ncbi:MAG TPA: hypothetical protein VFO29_05690 [Candidatus Rubrimentiphilum sp.]|nr:hypothetical protein [Candidatus Rubrimentiphilum sp.]
METWFGRAARQLRFANRELEIVVGSLLGDATLQKTSSGYCFRVHHGIHQRSLVDWKYNELKRFVRTPPRESAGGYYFRTVTHPELSRLRFLFYPHERKTVPIEILARYMSALSLAVWIMDDGAADGRQVRLNTQCFSSDEARQLVVLCESKFGIAMTINRDKGRPRLRCSAASMRRVVALVTPHMIPEMEYKLSRPLV